MSANNVLIMGIIIMILIIIDIVSINKLLLRIEALLEDNPVLRFDTQEVSFRDRVIILLAAINERLSRIEVFIQQKVGDEYPADNRDDWDRARQEDKD